MRGMRAFALRIALCLMPFATLAQDTTSVYVFGKVRNYDSAHAVPGATVAARDTLLAFAVSTTTDDSGKYALDLPYEHAYLLSFSCKGLVTKHLILDAREVPADDRAGGAAMNIDITLLERLEGVDYAVLDRPIGRCLYSATEHGMVWDILYTQALRSAIRSTTDAHQAARSQMVTPAKR